MFISIGTGWRMISLKNFSLSSILLSHNEGSLGLRAFHQRLQVVRATTPVDKPELQRKRDF